MAVVWPSKNNFANGDVLTASNMNNIADTLNVFNPTSATNGQVWVANGSGSGAYGTPAGSFTSLSSGSLSTSQLDLQNISQAYRNLVLQLSNVTFSALNNWFLRFNNLSTDYTNQRILNGTTPSLLTAASGLQLDAGAFNVGDTFNILIVCPNYTITKIPYAQYWVQSNRADGTPIQIGHGVRQSATAAISRLTVIASSTATFTAGTFTLWGQN